MYECVEVEVVFFDIFAVVGFAVCQAEHSEAEATAFLEQLIAFRKRLRVDATLIESGASIDAFLAEINSLLLQYPRRTSSPSLMTYRPISAPTMRST